MSADGHQVELTAETEATIRDLARLSADGRETGGILLGRFNAERGAHVITAAAGPGQHADREPGFFLRDLSHAREVAREGWHRDRSEWIGEWHTHPQGPMHPSELDLSTYAGLLARTDLAFPFFVSVIVTPCESGWESLRLNLWVLSVE
jgi:integrative and conjugative element protein (TIGR02256 family)